MRKDVKDMTGVRFRTRTVISYAGAKKWLVRCDCGAEATLAGADIRRNRAGRGDCRCKASELYRFKTFCEPLENGCVAWTGCRNEDGYGRFKALTGKCENAHRWAWIEKFGPVPKGKELDHLCRNRACVNPDHLEAVTHHENVIRGRLGEVTRERFARARQQA